MQISDEMLDRADMAFRLSSADRKGALRAALEYALSALSLPVQPVAGSLYGEYTPISVSSSTSTPPVPPTKGPEDDLRAADIERLAWNCDEWPKWLDEIVTSTNEVADRLDMSAEQAHAFAALLALRSRPASALPVVVRDGDSNSKLNGVE